MIHKKFTFPLISIRKFCPLLSRIPVPFHTNPIRFAILKHRIRATLIDIRFGADPIPRLISLFRRVPLISVERCKWSPVFSHICANDPDFGEFLILTGKREVINFQRVKNVNCFENTNIATGCPKNIEDEKFRGLPREIFEQQIGPSGSFAWSFFGHSAHVSNSYLSGKFLWKC